jgi:tetratricopeptide (TPR) repeat protein
LVLTHQALGYLLADRSRWGDAARQLARVIELRPRDPEPWLMQAGFLILAGDTAGYRSFCQRLRDDLYPKLEPGGDGRPAYLLARTCLLAPGGVEPAAGVRLAEEALAAAPQYAWYLHALALAHYRAGQYQRAVERLQESIKVDPGWAGRVDDWLILALAHEHLGHAAEAAQWLARALDGLPPGDYFFDNGIHAHDRLACEVLRREVDTLLPAEAEPILRECLALLAKTQPDHWRTFHTRSLLGGALLGQKKYKDAEPLLLAGYRGMMKRERAIPPPDRVRLTEALERLVQLSEAVGTRDKAADWGKKLASARAVDRLWQDLLEGQEARYQFTETRHQAALTSGKEGQVHLVNLQAGKTYVLDLESTAFDTFLKVEDPDGANLLAKNDDIVPGLDLNSRIIFQPPTSGTFRVLATAYNSGDTGPYVLRIRELLSTTSAGPDSGPAKDTQTGR